jgi:hypothetical protein
MRFLHALFITASFGSVWPASGHPQQAVTTLPSSEGGAPPLAGELRQTAVAVPDSIRQKAGYQHWKGGALGGTLGAVAGLLLSKYPIGCHDCSATDSEVVRATFIGAGLGGAFGFLVGAASPKYKWRSAAPDIRPAPKSESDTK